MTQNKVTVICSFCGKSEQVYPSRAKTYKFCGYICMGATKRGKPSHNRIDLPTDEIVMAYKAGSTQTALAEKHGVSIPTISDRLVGAGIEKHKPTGANLRTSEAMKECRNAHPHGEQCHNFADLPINELANEYMNGDSGITIGKKYGVSGQTIIRKLRTAGIKISHPGFTRPRRCKDGHVVASRFEQGIDEWLTEHGIEHEVHPPCPWPAKWPSNPRADFLVGSTYIEVWGIEGNEKYDARRLEKLVLYKESNAKLIEIYSRHILDKDYSSLLPLL